MRKINFEEDQQFIRGKSIINKANGLLRKIKYLQTGFIDLEIENGQCVHLIFKEERVSSVASVGIII